MKVIAGETLLSKWTAIYTAPLSDWGMITNVAEQYFASKEEKHFPSHIANNVFPQQTNISPQLEHKY